MCLASTSAAALMMEAHCATEHVDLRQQQPSTSQTPQNGGPLKGCCLPAAHPHALRTKHCLIIREDDNMSAFEKCWWSGGPSATGCVAWLACQRKRKARWSKYSFLSFSFLLGLRSSRPCQESWAMPDRARRGNRGKGGPALFSRSQTLSLDSCSTDWCAFYIWSDLPRYLNMFTPPDVLIEV